MHASDHAANPVIKECHTKGALISTALFTALYLFGADSRSEGNKISAIEI